MDILEDIANRIIKEFSVGIIPEGKSMSVIISDPEHQVNFVLTTLFSDRMLHMVLNSGLNYSQFNCEIGERVLRSALLCCAEHIFGRLIINPHGDILLHSVIPLYGQNPNGNWPIKIALIDMLKAAHQILFLARATVQNSSAATEYKTAKWLQTMSN